MARKKQAQELEQELKAAGFVYTRGGRHDVWHHPTGIRAVISRSQPGERGEKNRRANIRRNIRQAQELEEASKQEGRKEGTA